MENKIQSHHLSKPAYVYLRQSSPGQVRYNRESTQRQYALQDKAQQMGWSQSSIKVLDGDLGVSGSSSINRESFKTLVADVSMGMVGAVFALEASRLSRSCTDWHRLLELCAMTNTLIIDEDGCYNPANFNDQLILGLKATMSYAELHFIRARLNGARTNKAKKGELKIPLPIGFCYDERGHIKLDPDEQVRAIIHLLFDIFKEKGSANGVMLYFREHKIKFPKRAYGNVWGNKLFWEELDYARVLNILKNPSYAGVYVYGRFDNQRKISPEGYIRRNQARLPIDKWAITIDNHHERYISWERYLENQNTLKKNRPFKEGSLLPSAVREGLALLQGLLICHSCGQRLTNCYQGNKGISPAYSCSSRQKAGLDHSGCFTTRAKPLDEAISQEILNVVKPLQIEIAINAFEELKKRNNELEKQWRMKIERATYESQLARRRYEDVDSSNRLVAASLEKEWNESLIELEQIHCQYAEHQKRNVLTSIDSQKERVMELAKNLPLLWNAPSTSAKDRKRILRLLIKDITVEKLKDEQKVILHIRWQGGDMKNIEVSLPEKIYDQWRHPPEIINKVRELSRTMTNKEIAIRFQEEGLITNRGTPFTHRSIRGIRYTRRIPFACREQNELSFKEVIKKFKITRQTISRWTKEGILSTRRVGGRIWFLVDPKKEIELISLAKQRVKRVSATSKLQPKAEGGAI